MRPLGLRSLPPPLPGAPGEARRHAETPIRLQYGDSKSRAPAAFRRSIARVRAGSGSGNPFVIEIRRSKQNIGTRLGVDVGVTGQTFTLFAP
jgi:hypothetical protein